MEAKEIIVKKESDNAQKLHDYMQSLAKTEKEIHAIIGVVKQSIRAEP